VARVRCHLGLHAAQQENQNGRYLRAGRFELDIDRRRARFGDRATLLSEREFALLAHLVRRRGEVCSRTELLHDVWGLDFDPGSNVIEVYVRRLRAKLDDAPIETVRGVGYMLAAG
jgi:DNA-binding response OmpR family regulator